MDEGILARWAAFAVHASAPDRAATSRQLADTTIALLAGARTADGEALAQFAQATAEGGTLALAATLAATIRLTELDDIHRPSAVTASAIVVPAALAFGAPRPEASRLADALHVGEELAIRLAMALGGARMLARGWWPSLTVAPLGAAATAGRMLNLGEREMQHALALALAQTPPPIGRTPAVQPGRWLLFGAAVRAGCLAALAAQRGFHADTALLDANWLHRFDPAAEHAHWLDAGLPGNVRAQTSVKPHPGAKQTMAAIAGLQQLMVRGIAPESIDAVTLRVPGAYAAMIVREAPDAGRLASFVSAPGQLALAALCPRALDDADRSSVAWSPARLDFARGVTVSADASLDALYPHKWPAHVSVSANGERHEIDVSDGPGDPDLPFDANAIRGKAERLVVAHADRQWVDVAAAAATDADALRALQEWAVRRFGTHADPP
ncbi:MmgE/PrpD family protein [Paraburkholderia acidisoli]|uniref:2-methylcitrate dehydratase PrpD n=1 Tax=Paraburkholderia acidisoli TaxID=2571748 RepID=A0A7Z2GQP7_9BURK|nr:MmgE/PrpD family protein [Paraburkholderia acidisoli]QGZ66212.1 hypothetical protein FAZ98_30865 [Paraburkholderia acidisoli]